jgi:hypothetical protein
MPWLVLAYALTFGFVPQDVFVFYTPPDTTSYNINSNQQFSVDMAAELRIAGIGYVGGDIRIYEWMNEAAFLDFWPNRGAFSFRAGLRFGGLEIGYEHYCTHPIAPYLPYFHYDLKWDGGYDEFHVKLTGESVILK